MSSVVAPDELIESVKICITKFDNENNSFYEKYNLDRRFIDRVFSKVEISDVMFDRLCAAVGRCDISAICMPEFDGYDIDRHLCIICEEWKAYDEFYKDSTRNSGTRGSCTSCRREVMQKRKERLGIKPRRTREIVNGTTECFCCDQWKGLWEFRTDRRSPVGVSARCKECINSEERKKRLAKKLKGTG